MATTSSDLTTEQRREEMVHQMCACVDGGEAERFGSWFAEDASYRFANTDALTGRAAVVAATQGAIDSMPWVRHTVDQVAQVADQLFCRFTITTEAPDGTEVSMPCVTVIWMDGAQIVDYRVHMDLAPILPAPA